MNLGEERDPMLGVHAGSDADSDVFTVPDEPIRKRHTNILQFNTLQGGEYLLYRACRHSNGLVSLTKIHIRVNLNKKVRWV